MKLSKIALEAAKDRAIKLRLALELGFTELWINKLLDANKENSPLTTAKALQVIKQETGLTEQEILEEEVVKA